MNIWVAAMFVISLLYFVLMFIKDKNDPPSGLT